MIKSRARRAWNAMKNRVSGASGTQRTRDLYLGMPIEPDWQTSFAAFLADLGECPPGHSLDRIDGTKGYVRGNCRWVDIVTQNSNRSSCIYVQWGDERVTAEEASRRSGVKYTTLLRRIKCGWPQGRWFEPARDALTRAQATAALRAINAGADRKELAAKLGVKYSTIAHLAAGHTWKSLARELAKGRVS